VVVSERRGGLGPQGKGDALSYIPGSTVRWSALSHVALTPMTAAKHPTLWSGSPTFQPRGVYPSSRIYIDADAWTPIHAYRDPAELTFLRYDAITSAHVLRPHGTACVIGVGGGRDLLSALHYGHPRVVGIEINPDIVTLLKEMAVVSPVAKDPRVELIIGDGRSVLARRDFQCSVLQASLIDTWAATSAGAFAHTEATLYTREAWSLFLRRVEPDGILTFSRWYKPGRHNEIVRLVSLAMAALLDRGVTNPRDHVAVVATGAAATILVSPHPFSAADRAALARLESEMKFALPVAPGRRAADPIIEQLLESKTVDSLAEAGVATHIDSSAPTDDRPFFFQLLAPAAWLHPETMLTALFRGGLGGGVIPGNVMAMLGMVIMLAVVLAIGIVLLGPTIVRSLRARPAALPSGSAWFYFAALGAGFMIAEIALVQRMHVILGHPTYALIVVLAGMLVATGIGSALSPRVLRSRRSVSIAALIAAIWLIVLPLFVIGPLAERTMHASLAVRALWTGSCAALVGLLLGMFFPSGLRFTNRELGAPAALAINGVTSVIGGGAAIMVSVAFGIPASFILAAAFYFLASLSGPIRWPAVD
jgi:SAM-dependent methyltransferase